MTFAEWIVSPNGQLAVEMVVSLPEQVVAQLVKEELGLSASDDVYASLAVTERGDTVLHLGPKPLV